MNKIQVKYCGLKTAADIEAAVASKVDAIGLVLVKKSPRYVNLNTAKELADLAKPEGLKVVVLFADHSVAEVKKAIAFIKPDILQFHGSETAAFCEQFNHAYWKAIPMLTTDDYSTYMDEHPKAEAFLLDAFGGQQSGGSGKAFNWFKFPENLKSKLILAGGINQENVIEALSQTGAQYIDTSSGIESSPGVKSKSKMLALMNQVRHLSS